MAAGSVPAGANGSYNAPGTMQRKRPGTGRSRRCGPTWEVLVAAQYRPKTMKERIDELRDRREKALHPGSAKAVEVQHDKGKLTARERIDALLDPGSFMELDAFAAHRATAFGMDAKKVPGDGVVTGYGTVGGRRVWLRRDLLAQRAGVRRGPAALADHGAVGRRGGLLPGDHRLHPDGQGDLVHVHHRPGGGPGGDR